MKRKPYYDWGQGTPTVGRGQQAEPAANHAQMPNIAVVLKEEIARLARKEMRAQTQELKKASAQYRTHIASLRKRVETLERQVKRATRSTGRGAAVTAPQETGDESTSRRFSPKRL